jgi:sugar phosphate isomerase/epimerase
LAIGLSAQARPAVFTTNPSEQDESMLSISRRRFLQQGALAAAAFTSSRHRAWGSPDKIPIGLQLYTVGADLQKDTAGTLRQVRSIGYKEVETAGFAGLTAKQFRAALDDAGLSCHSAHVQMVSPDLGPVFDDAHAIGAHYVVSSALFPPNPGHLPTLDDYKTLAARLNDIGRKAKETDLQYAYHNHNFEFREQDGKAIGYDVLLKETDPALVKFELDCGWMIAAGYSPVEYFQRYPTRYKMIHVKDFVRGGKVSTSLSKELRPQGTELGRGHIDYKPILSAAAKIGVRYYYVEQEPPFPEMPALDAAKVDYNYLRGL